MAVFKGEGNACRITGRVVGEVKSSRVGANETPLTRFGVKCGEGRDGEIMNVKCWRGLAESAASLHSGDLVDVAGFIESREHNDKTYYDLSADYSNVASIYAPQMHVGDAGSLFTDIGSDDIPF